MISAIHSAIPSPFRFSLLLASLLLINGCSGGNAPENSWENAVKGNYSAALSDNGALSIIGSITHGGSLWNTAENERLYDWNHRQGEFSNIIASGFSPDGLFALTADHQTMVLWNTTDGSPVTFWTAPSEVHSIDLSPNGNYALLGLADHSAVLFDVKRGGIKRSFYHTGPVLSVDLSNDGKIAITGSQDRSAKLWNMTSGEILFNWEHKDDVITVAISADGKRALSVAKYDRAVIWDTETGKKIGALPLKASAIKRGQAFSSARFSMDGLQLLTGNADREVQLWDTNNMTEIAHWTVPKRDPWKPTSASILALSFSPSPNEFFAIASNGFTHHLKK